MRVTVVCYQARDPVDEDKIVARGATHWSTSMQPSVFHLLPEQIHQQPMRDIYPGVDYLMKRVKDEVEL